jgi:hypothetical protein
MSQAESGEAGAHATAHQGANSGHRSSQSGYYPTPGFFQQTSPPYALVFVSALHLCFLKQAAKTQSEKTYKKQD